MGSEDDGATLTTPGLHSHQDHDDDDDDDHYQDADDYHDADEDDYHNYHDDADDDDHHDADDGTKDYDNGTKDDDNNKFSHTLENIQVIVQDNVINLEDECRTDRIKNSLDQLTENGL